jgi:predicted DCC family thiol-disulfide oxidoreductase YuxK
MDGAQAPVAQRAERWVVLYDGECGLCKWMLAGILRWDRGSRLRPLALQSSNADAMLCDLERGERMASWHLVSPCGERSSSGAALSRLLGLLPGGALPAAATERFPALTERAYRWVADHRSALSKLVPAASKRRADARVHACEQALEKR